MIRKPPDDAKPLLDSGFFGLPYREWFRDVYEWMRGREAVDVYTEDAELSLRNSLVVLDGANAAIPQDANKDGKEYTILNIGASSAMVTASFHGSGSVSLAQNEAITVRGNGLVFYITGRA